VGSLFLALASCGKSRAKSFVRIVNASPDAGIIDISINGNKILSGAAYGSGSNYFNVAPGNSIDFKITKASDQTTLIDTKIGLTDKAYYTIAAVGLTASPSTFTILKTTDEHSSGAGGTVKIRVLQLDPFFHVNSGDAGPVDAYSGPPADPLTPPLPPPPPPPPPFKFPTVSFGTMTPFVALPVPPGGNLRIRVAPAGDPDPDNTNLPGWDSQTVLFKAGQVRTYVLLNNPTGTPYPTQSLMLNDLN
jgi:hypothetical protein